MFFETVEGQLVSMGIDLSYRVLGTKSAPVLRSGRRRCMGERLTAGRGSLGERVGVVWAAAANCES